jgi:hypothetical protein
MQTKTGNIGRITIELVENGYVVHKFINNDSYHIAKETKYVYVDPSDVGNFVTNELQKENKRRDLNA